MLGDLSVSEVEEFERHFFDCPQCSEELRALSILQENARVVFMEQDSAPSPQPSLQIVAPVTEPQAARASWWSFNIWAPAMAMIAIAVFVGFELGERGADQPQSVNSFPIYAAKRGGETSVAPSANAKFFTVYMDRTWDRDYASYRAIVREDNASHQERVSMPLASPAQGSTIQILFPGNALKTGKYVLSILGKDEAGKESTAAEYPFTYQIK
jgi:hypothetical protein